MAQGAETKICSKCGLELPATLEHFHRHGSGIRPDCKKCRISSRARHYQANKDRVRTQVSAWREANKDRDEAYRKSYREANREKILLRSTNWQKANPDAAREIRARWREANPEKAKAMWHERRAREKQAGGSFGSKDIKNLYQIQGGKCPYCGISLQSGYHIDHFLPLVLGGTNDINNLVLACPRCNLSKGAKHPKDWLTQDRPSLEILTCK